MSPDPKSTISGLVLGLDIGAASVGWALVEFEQGRPKRLEAMGARVFPAAVSEGTVDSIEAGREKSSARGRREARSRRRQTDRTRRRLRKLTKLLQRHDLLPPGPVDTPRQVHDYFLGLDGELFPEGLGRRDEQVRYYRLRARALDEPLTRHEIGRALYHLAHRRGFLSNAKATTRREKEEGPVRERIAELGGEMRESEARTLGEYLSRLDPQDERIRGPKHYVGRDEQIRPEFEEIWRRQAAHHPDLLTDDLRQQVACAIFFQRPFRTPTRHLGFCSVERDPRDPQRRAPMALLAAQRFRVLDKVNVLQFISGGESRVLRPEERTRLLQKLDATEKLDFDSTRKLLKLPEGRFNLETLGTKHLIGNRTAARLARIIGRKRWGKMACAERDRLVDDLLTRSSQAVYRRALRRGIDEEAARKLSRIELDSGHCRLSRRALERVLPLMEDKGLPYATARQECYPRRAADALALLPPLSSVEQVRNPIVTRALTEMRKVVNAIVRKYGLPARVRIELARDLKRSKDQRRYLHGRMLGNERSRQEAKEALAGMGEDPSDRNAERYLLWEECNRHCPYCSQPISQTDLFGPQVQVDHIIPRPRALHLGNSFLNKTLCHAACNQDKGNRTPFERFGDTSAWETILANVRKFRSGGRGRDVGGGDRGKTQKKPRANSKLELFELRKVDLDEFTRRQLQDTQYAARLAVEYVGQLYGAGSDGNDAEGIKRVQVGRGQVTNALRAAWDLNSTEIGGGERKRDDHRQHAIDALCVALTDGSAIKGLSEAAERGYRGRGYGIDRMAPPWPTLIDEVRCAVSAMVASHRVAHRVAGGMHKDTHYGRYQYDGRAWAHVRVPLAGLSASDVRNIVDPEVQKRVVDALGTGDPKEAFRDPRNHPRLGRNPIHKVRVRRPKTPLRTLGAESRERHVELDSNHHVEVFEVTGARGKVWRGEVVSTYDAMRRVRHKGPRESLVHRDREGFLFSLTGGDTIELDERGAQDAAAPGAGAGRRLYVVRTIAARSDGDVELALAAVSDARKKADLVAHKDAWRRLRINSLRGHCRKVLVTPLGEVRTARD